MQMNREIAKQLSTQAQKAIEAAFAGKAVIKIGSGSFDRNSLNIKFNIAPGGANDIAQGEREKFADLAILAGLTPQHYGAVVTVKNKRLTLCGIRPRSRKFPVEARDEATGKIWFITTFSAKQAVPVKATKAAVKTKINKPTFAVNQKVNILWDEDGEWYPGKVVSINTKGKFVIRYTSGEQETVTADHLQTR